MQCPKCRFNNPQGARYCQRCANIFSYSGEAQHIPENTRIEVMPHEWVERKQGGHSLTLERHEDEKDDHSGNVPLRKWSQLFRVSIDLTWSKKWRFVFLNIIPKLIWLIPFIVLLIIFIIVNSININDSIRVIVGIIGLLALIFGVLIFGVLWSHIAYIYFLYTAEESKKIILRQSFKKILSYWWVSILQGFTIFCGLLLFIVPGIVWGVKFGLAQFALLLEGYKGIKALKRSAELTKGYRWSIFKRSMLFSYFQFLIQIIFAAVFLLVNLFGDLSTVFTVLSFIIYFVLILINILISLLLEPLAFVYDFDIYNNLWDIKNLNSISKEKYNFRQKLWIFVLLLIFPLAFLLIGLTTGTAKSSYYFEDSLKNFLPSSLIGDDFEQKNDFNVDDVDNTQAKTRDAKRVSDIKQIQASLEFYYAKNKVYPIALAPVVLGKGNFACLDVGKGFNVIGECTQGILIFSEVVPANPEPGGSDYIYQSNGLSYRIDFELEIGVFGFKPGANSISTEEFAKKLEQIEEEFNKTDVVDSDNDGIPDNLELLFGTDPNKPEDPDGDGLLNDEEEIWKTDPTKPDTDFDGLSDKDEIYKWHTDPLNSDTDGDGYLDGVEVMNGFNPLGSGKLE